MRPRAKSAASTRSPVRHPPVSAAATALGLFLLHAVRAASGTGHGDDASQPQALHACTLCSSHSSVASAAHWCPWGFQWPS